MDVGVTPTECWLKGDVNPRTPLERKFSRWSLYSRLERTRELEDHITDVIEQRRSTSSSNSLRDTVGSCNLWRISSPVIRVST
jgi:hypothetical protein